MHVVRSLKVVCSVQQLHPVGTRQSYPLLVQTGACCCNEFEIVSDSPSLSPSSPFPLFTSRFPSKPPPVHQITD
jgi:hypothetical protein